METSKNIINHVLNKPLYSKVKQIKCFNRLKELLPIRLQRGIVFIYKKDKTLTLVLSHPSFKMELNYKLYLIKIWLKELKKIDNNCQGLDIETVKTLVTNRGIDKKNKRKIVSFYVDKSDGDFENLAIDKNIKNLFEKIKKTIKDKK